MRRLGYLALLAATLDSTCLALQTAKPSEIGLSNERLQAVTEFLQSEVDANRIAGAVGLIARHGRIGYLQAVGHQNREQGLPMQTDTIFRIASMTKAITSAAVMQLVNDGQLRLDDPVSKFLPEFSEPNVLESIDGDSMATVPASHPPTIHELLTHTSGLPYGWFGPAKLDRIYHDNDIPNLFVPIQETLAERVQRIGHVPLKFQPGTAWDYGLSLDVLGRVIEVVSGLHLDQFFEERFFRPLGMDDSAFFVDASKQHRLAALYTIDANQSLRAVGNEPVTAGFLRFTADYCTHPDGRFLSGGGGLTATATDYARFLQLLLDDGEWRGQRILSAKSVHQMTQNQIGDFQLPFPGHGDGFGYGFGVLTEEGRADDLAAVGTVSWGGIFNTYYWADPQHEMVGVLMTQIFPYNHLNTRERFKELAYAALDDSGFRRVYWYEKGLEHGNPHFNNRQIRVNAPEVSIHPTFASRSEPRSSGLGRIHIDEDLRLIDRAELYCELWGGHPGTIHKRVHVNGRNLLRFSEVGSADGHCTHQYQRFGLNVTDLVNGYNSLQFACDQGDTFWGHFIVDNAALEIGLPSNHPDIAGAGLQETRYGLEVTSSTADSIVIALTGDPESLDQAAKVHVEARYFGYDENGDGVTTDWHGMTKGRLPYGHVASRDRSPFEARWDTSMIPAQPETEFRATVELKDQTNLIYRTQTISGPAVIHPNKARVSLHHAADLPDHFWSRAGRLKTCGIDLDIDPDSIERAQLHVVAWTGGAGAVEKYFTLNGHHFPIAEGHSHEVDYSIVPVDPAVLKRGRNEIALLSDTTHHGIEILRPGPALAIRHRQ